ncbi:hypothetical protein DVH24_042387 [Malus domestica]|uniref:Uncharacterized protein n=1 Tax=Malus domestica TaxID=3750 RepID=A0A498IZ14_MALDO|nr:hypothetical protein DVH24_042387 [Malus domestica]
MVKTFKLNIYNFLLYRFSNWLLASHNHLCHKVKFRDRYTYKIKPMSLELAPLAAGALKEAAEHGRVFHPSVGEIQIPDKRLS